jgi:hypothetical protein
VCFKVFRAYYQNIDSIFSGTLAPKPEITTFEKIKDLIIITDDIIENFILELV